MSTNWQQWILSRMQQGKGLSSLLSIEEGQPDREFGGDLEGTRRSILISTIKAMLRKGLIVESARYKVSDGEQAGKKHELWHINYAINRPLDDVVSTPEGTRFRCALCKALFPHEEITYLEGDCGYTKLCKSCFEKPESDCFLPYMQRLALGLVSDDEIRNWNAVHAY